MKIIKTKLKNCLVIEPDVFSDKRGFFLESFNLLKYQKLIEANLNFVQDNHSHSSKNVLRGLHFQKNKPQGKLVRVVRGEVFDVAVDIRKNSLTFGQWEGVFLSEKNKRQFWVPPGFAHGFLVLSEFADFEYKCTDYYDPNDEGCIMWNDESIGIDWPSMNPSLSEKDKDGKSLDQI